MNKKIRFSLLTLLVMLCGTAFADTYTYEFTANTFTAAGTKALGDANWTLTTGTSYFGWDKDKAQQIGSSKVPAASIVLATSDIAGTISEIKVTTSGASSIAGTLDVTVGGTAFGSQYTLTSTSTEATFTGSASGEIKLNYAQTSSKAIYIKKIEVTYAKAAPEPTGYSVDFNTAIATSSHDFAVASKWKHIVEDNDGSYVGYKWDAAYGTGDPATGGLLVYSQKVGSSSWDMATVYDLLVTPKVSGTIKLKVKAYENASSSTKAFVQLYSLNGAATAKAEMLKEFQTEIPGYSTGNGDWVELTYNVTESQRIGIRAQYVYMDDFYAEAVDTTPEAALIVSSVMDINGNSGTQGTNPIFEQQADSTMKVVLKVTLTNTGDIDFVAGTTSNYTLTPAQKYYGDLTYYEDASIAIPEDIAVGESKTFNVEFTVPYVSGYKYWYVKENVTGTTSTSYRYATSVAYESKFILRVAESGSTSDLTTAQDFGRISAAETRSFEIYNDGTAPLTIKSITLPEGFTSDNLPEIPSEGLVLAKKTATAAFNVTLPVTTTGDFSGNLVIKYVKAGDSEESTKTLAFSGTVLAEGTWFADFNGDKSSSSAIVYPAGSIVESSTLTSAYTGSYGSYDHYLKSYNRRDANKFITPKLHATAGATLKFDAIKYQSGNDYDIKVYVSTDRKTWGEAKMTVSNTDAQFESTSTRYTQTLTFDAEGDYYVAFDVYGMGLDNIIGLTKVAVAHDMYIKTATLVAEAQTGSTIKPKATIVPLTDETAESYTVRYYVDDVAVAQGTAVALTAKADATTDFTISYTPNDEVTTTHDTYIEFEFTDGTKIATEHQTLKVTNEPKFLFVEASTSVNQYTTNLTKSQAFGKTNKADTKAFKIYNQGTAVLQITGITAPEGFSVNKTGAFEVAAGASEEIIVTFSATTPGEYKDSLIVNYTQEGAKPYKLEFTGTMLDAAKWYANFDNPTTNAIIWPAGSVYESSINTSYSTYSAPYNYYIYSRSATKNKFTTPKLTAAAGDVFSFDAKAYNSYNDGKIKVYASATRDELGDPVADLTLSNTDWATQNVTIANAGDYYITIEFSDASLDEFYGLKPAAVAHDLKIASSNVPAEGMQNTVYTASVNILNFGLKDETAADYTMTVFVNGEPVATGETVAVPMNHKVDDAGTAVSASFRYPKAGTFPVYVEVKAGELSLKTTPVDVTFAEEVAVADAIAVGTKSSSGRDYGFVDWYNNDGNNTRYTDILYPAAKLTAAGIKAGDKINSIAFRASNSSKTFKAVVTSWVGTSTGEITFGSPVKENMQEISIYNGSVEFPANFESVITLTTPIVWDGTSDIRVYTEAVGQGSSNYVSANYDYDSDIQMSYNGTTKAAPLAYFTLATEPTTISGTVKNAEGTAIEGATVTLISNDGDGVEYTGKTDAEGAYSINVIQNTRTYNVEVEAEGYKPTAEIGVSFAEGSVNKDFVVVFDPSVVIANADFEGEYTVYSNPQSNRAIYQPTGWTVTYQNGNENDLTSLNSSCLQWNNFSGKPQLATGGDNTYWIRFRWGNKAYIKLSQTVTLPAGEYRLTAEAFANGASGAAATISAAGVSTSVAGNSTWKNYAVDFTLTEKTAVTIAFDLKQNQEVENIAAFDNFRLGYKADIVKVDLEAEISKAIALITPERTEGLTEFEAAIEAAEALLTSTDVAAITDGIETLKAAEAAFIKTNLIAANAALVAGASVDNPVAAPFVVNGTFDENTNGWTCTGGFANKGTATNQQGDFTGKFWENWNGSAKVNKMYQAIENIPNGVYKLNIAAFVNILANPNESQFVFANKDSVYLTTGEPTMYEVYTMVEGNALEIGLEQTTATANWMGIDNVSLTYFGADATIEAVKIAAHKNDWKLALQAAQAALRNEDYAAVTGDEKTALETEISKEEPATAEAYDAATANLKTATQTFISAAASYNALIAANAMIVDLPYAAAAKKPEAKTATNAADAATAAQDVIVGLRAYYESNAMAEGVEGAVNYTTSIVNPAAEADIAEPWVVVKGEGSNGALDVKNGEPWTDGAGNSTHKYFDGGDWGANAWNVALEQKINLPAGKYMLTAKGRAATDVDLSLFAGEESTKFASIGSTGGLFDRGWNDASVEFKLKKDSTITIGVRGITKVVHNWMSFSDFRLVQLEEEPILAGDANLNGEVTTSDAVAAVSFALKTETPSEKAHKAADVDKSGDIDVADVVAIVNIALEIPEPEPTSRGDMKDVNFLTMNGNALELMNTTEFVGFQMDVTLANGAMLNGVSLAERAAGLQVAYNRIADNTYRIIAFSTTLLSKVMRGNSSHSTLLATQTLISPILSLLTLLPVLMHSASVRPLVSRASMLVLPTWRAIPWAVSRTTRSARA